MVPFSSMPPAPLFSFIAAQFSAARLLGLTAIDARQNSEAAPARRYFVGFAAKHIATTPELCQVASGVTRRYIAIAFSIDTGTEVTALLLSLQSRIAAPEAREDITPFSPALSTQPRSRIIVAFLRRLSDARHCRLSGIAYWSDHGPHIGRCSTDYGAAPHD